MVPIAGSKVGRCRAGKATRILAIADRDGLPVSVCIGDGSGHDVTLTEHALDEAHVDLLPPNLVGDKAWDSKKHQVRLREERGIELTAPARSTCSRKPDGRRMRRDKRKWNVERLFAWLQNFRRYVVRWEYKAESFLGFLQLGCIVILLRHL